MMYNNLILDLDGTVYLDKNPIGDVINQLNILNSKNNNIFFLTNNTSKTKNQYVDNLNALGLDFVTSFNLITPLDTFLNFSKKNKIESCYYVMPKEVKNWINTKKGPIHTKDNPDIILIGFDKELSYQKIETVSKLVNTNIPYYLTNIDLSCPTINGPIPDTGAIASLIFKTTNKKFKDSFGKPSMNLIHFIKDFFNENKIDLKKSILAGDRIYTDILLGNILNIDTLHVLSGEKTHAKNNDAYPKFEFKTLSDFLRWHYKV